MAEITGILTDDQGTITHLTTIDSEQITVDELAQHLSEGHDYYVTFDEGKRYSITIVAEDGHLEPTVDDPEGVHTIWDLPQDQDPAETNIDETFDVIADMGEAERYTFGGPEELSSNPDEEDKIEGSL
jgi:FtsP/CotA-like multicopper oxidase with cupredoxin domain